MKKGFEVIKTRPINENVNIGILEEEYSIKLPMLYRVFCQYFQGGDFASEMYQVDGKQDLAYCAGTYYEPKGKGDFNIGITSIYTLQEVFDKRAKLFGYGDEDIERGLLRIADIGMGGGLFVGTMGDENDKIILCIWDNDPPYEIIADNIFHFIQGLVMDNIPEDELIQGVQHSDLYKNWGEDFWRVKEHNSNN